MPYTCFSLPLGGESDPSGKRQKRTGWSTASAARATLERCQLEPLRLDQCQRQQPGTGTGSRPPPPTICTGMHPAQQIATASADRRPEQQRTTRRRPGLFLLPIFHACRLPGLPDQQPGTRWALPAAAPDDHASSSPPPTMTTHQRQPCTTCTAPTACQPCQTSQRQRQPPAPPPRRTSPPAPPTCRRLHCCRLPDDPPRRTPQNGHFAPPPEGSDSPPNGIEL